MNTLRTYFSPKPLYDLSVSVSFFSLIECRQTCECKIHISHIENDLIADSYSIQNNWILLQKNKQFNSLVNQVDSTYLRIRIDGIDFFCCFWHRTIQLADHKINHKSLEKKHPNISAHFRSIISIVGHFNIHLLNIHIQYWIWIETSLWNTHIYLIFKVVLLHA